MTKQNEKHIFNLTVKSNQKNKKWNKSKKYFLKKDEKNIKNPNLAEIKYNIWGIKMLIKKRDGKIVEYDSNKILVAISKANREVELKEKATIDEINKIIDNIENKFEEGEYVDIEKIQDEVEKQLMEAKNTI